MSGAAALSWEVVARHRWWFRVFGAYLILASVAVPFLSSEWQVPEVGVALAAPAVILGLVTLAGFGGGGNLRRTESGFPCRLFALPLSSFTLASTQFGVVVATLAGLWLVAAVGLLRPCGAAVPFAAPALGIAAVVGWVLALAWSPFPLPWLRLLFTAGVLAGASAFLVAISGSRVSLNQLTALLALAVSGAYVVAWNGVRLARRGVWANRVAPIDQGVTRSKPLDFTPFASPFRAQLSLELRSLRRALVWMALIQAFVVFPLVFLTEANLQVTGYSIYYSRHTVTYLGLYLFLVLPVASILIGSRPSSHLVSPRGGMPSFFATRPVSATTIVLAKMMSKVLLVNVLWGGFLLLAGLWFAVLRCQGDMATEFDARWNAPPFVAMFFQLVLAGVLWNWLVLIGGIWVGLCGRSWVSLVALATGCVLCAAVLTAWQEFRPDRHDWFVHLVYVALATKVGATLWVCWRLVARGHATAWALVLIVEAWMLFVVPIASLAAWLLPGRDQHWSGWQTALVVIQLTPLAQTLAAPLALDWNRHR